MIQVNLASALLQTDGSRCNRKSDSRLLVSEVQLNQITPLVSVVI